MSQGWHATTVPPCCHSCHHMIWPSLIRDHRNLGTCGKDRYRGSNHVNVEESRMTQGWHATTVPPCSPSCHHMIRPPLIRRHRNFGTTGSLPYKHRGIYRHSYATHKLSHEHVKHLSYQMFKTRLPGSEKSESSSAKFAAPSPLPEPTAITKRVLT